MCAKRSVTSASSSSLLLWTPTADRRHTPRPPRAGTWAVRPLHGCRGQSGHCGNEALWDEMRGGWRSSTVSQEATVETWPSAADGRRPATRFRAAKTQRKFIPEFVFKQQLFTLFIYLLHSTTTTKIFYLIQFSGVFFVSFPQKKFEIQEQHNKGHISFCQRTERSVCDPHGHRHQRPSAHKKTVVPPLNCCGWPEITSSSQTLLLTFSNVFFLFMNTGQLTWPNLVVSKLIVNSHFQIKSINKTD